MAPTTEDRLAKLRQLQRKKAEGSKKNREELYKEDKKRKANDQKLRFPANVEPDQPPATQQQQEIGKFKELGQNWERRKAWDWSIEDHERWDARMQQKQGNIKNAGFVNYDRLAEQTYKKEISLINTSAKQKETLKKNRDAKENKNQNYSNKPTKEVLDRLVKSMSRSDARKMAARKNYSETSNYINEKNKHFNDKLDRHYGGI